MTRASLIVASGVLASIASAGTITPGIPIGSFGGATVEKFQESYTVPTSYTWASGLAYKSHTGNGNHLNYTGGYGLCNGFVGPGMDGGNDGYFGTGPTPETFEFTFPTPSTLVGWYGAEAFCDPNDAFGRNGSWNMSFYDSANVLIQTIDDTANTGAWGDFHGYKGSSPISRVVFNGAGHMVVDNVMWFVPTPSSVALLGLAGLAGVRRRR